MAGFRYFVSWTLLRVLLFNGCLGLGGVLLIAYELSADSLRLRETRIDQLAAFLGALFTLVGVIATAASIYLPQGSATKPAPESYYTAFFVILGCIVAGAFLIFQRELPSNIVNGFALLGLAGAMFRIQPNPQKPAEPLRHLSATDSRLDGG